MNATIDLAQSRYDIENQVEIGGKDRYITGTVFFDKKGNGSVTIKVTSSLLSFEDDEIEAVKDSAIAALMEGYYHLRKLKEQHGSIEAGAVGTGNLFAQTEQTDKYITMQEQEQLAAAQENEGDIFKQTVEVKPGSLVDKANQSRKERTLRKVEDNKQVTGNRAAKV